MLVADAIVQSYTESILLNQLMVIDGGWMSVISIHFLLIELPSAAAFVIAGLIAQ